jgi:hypothetical protein
MPLPLPFNPEEDLPSLNQRIEWAEQGLLEGLESLPHPPLYEYECELWPLYKEPTEEELEQTRQQLQAGLIPVANSCKCGGGCSVAID